MIPTSAGLLVFLLCLAFCAQLLVGLYVGSAVTAAAWDAARTVSAGGPSARLEAEQEARKQLGRYGERVEFRWHETEDHVHLSVRARKPILLPAVVQGWTHQPYVDRTVSVRRETFQQ